MPIIKIAAVLGLIVAGITISIFMMGEPCDPGPRIKVPTFSSTRGEGFGSSVSAENGANWGNKARCKIESLVSPKKEISSSPSASIKSPAELKDSAPGSNLSTIFIFNSRDESKATGLKLESFTYKNPTAKKFTPYLPIKVVFETDGEIAWQGVVSAADCHDEEKIPYCEVRGYVNNPQWWKGALKLRAYDINGKRVAYFDYNIKSKGK